VLEGHRFSKQSVVHLCDNKNVEIILRKGSSNPGLQTVAMQIYKACRKYKIQLSAQWLPRTDSRIAVLAVMSKWQDLNDCGLSEFDFKILYERSDKFDIDLFACDYNYRVRSFFSPNPSDFCVGVNSFSFDWKECGFGYACPPVKKVIATIKHAILCGSRGVLVVPNWPASFYWKFLAFDGRHLNRMFINHMCLHLELKSGPLMKSGIFTGTPSFKMLLLYFDASVFNPLSPNVRSPSCLSGGCFSCK
jgi:hypothetical protein